MGLVYYENIAFIFTKLMGKILKIINMKGGSATPSEIVEQIDDASQSTISRNLRQLAVGGLIRIRKINGKQKECILTDKGKEALKLMQKDAELLVTA